MKPSSTQCATKCLNETRTVPIVIGVPGMYISANGQFVLWLSRVPTALREGAVHSYGDLPTFGGHLASIATLVKTETVIRWPTASKYGANQFDAIFGTNIARRHTVVWSICWSSSRFHPFHVYTLTWSSTNRCRQTPRKLCQFVNTSNRFLVSTAIYCKPSATIAHVFVERFVFVWFCQPADFTLCKAANSKLPSLKSCNPWLGL